MNRGRTAAVLLLCLTLLCGCARADWADWAEEQAEALCARMTALAVDEAYVSLFTGSEEVLSQVERMAANEGLEMEQVRRFTLRSESSYADYVEWEGLELPALSAVAGEELERRLAAMPPSLLNGQAGAEWLAAASLLTVSETYQMPEAFVPCIVLMDFGTEADVMAVFTRTGGDTVTGQAVFVSADVVDAGMDAVLLLYTEDEPEE